MTIDDFIKLLDKYLDREYCKYLLGLNGVMTDNNSDNIHFLFLVNNSICDLVIPFSKYKSSAEKEFSQLELMTQIQLQSMLSIDPPFSDNDYRLLAFKFIPTDIIDILFDKYHKAEKNILKKSTPNIV